jgi:ADP-heptose:LPS heptosyltransferase
MTLAKLLTREGIGIVFTSLKRIDLQEPSFINLTGKLTLRELLIMIATSDFIVTAATGPMHIAAAFDIPVFALFDPSLKDHLIRWKPLTEKSYIYLPKKDLAELDPEMIAQDIIRMLKAL